MKILTLIAYTFRELIARITLIVLAAISTLIILVTLLVLSSQETPEGRIMTMFGQQVSPPVPVEQFNEIIYGVQAQMAGGLFAGIIIFGIFATAGLLPDTMQRGTIDLYLSKPLGRWQLVLGKYLGGVSVIFANILYFIGALWLIFGLKVGVWNTEFLLSILVLTFVFACLYALVTLLGIIFRGSAVPIIASFLYLFVVGGLLHTREELLFKLSENVIYRGILDGFYYLLPQINGMQVSLGQIITHTPVSWEAFTQGLLSAVWMYGLATFIFHRRDF
jgi:ABC-type transport system involved in multi-copper enzyme maturation permease subunit